MLRDRQVTCHRRKIWYEWEKGTTCQERKRLYVASCKRGTDSASLTYVLTDKEGGEWQGLTEKEGGEVREMAGKENTPNPTDY